MIRRIHVEIALTSESTKELSFVTSTMQNLMKDLEDPVMDFNQNMVDDTCLKDELTAVKFSCEGATLRVITFFNKSQNFRDEINVEECCTRYETKLDFHAYKYKKGDLNGTEAAKEMSALCNHWVCPCEELEQLWESLQYTNDVKQKLLDYLTCIFRFSEEDDPLLCLNKMAIVYGEPGTGKTALCKAAAHKASIRLGNKFDRSQLVQLNLQNCFQSYSSDGACASLKLMDKLQDLVRDKRSLVFLLIDDIDNFARRRSTTAETAESVKSLQFIIHCLDRLRELPNVIVLATSSMMDALDPALTDRADLKCRLEMPSSVVAYKILATSLNEFLKKGWISSKEGIILPKSTKIRDKNHPLWEEIQLLQYIAEFCSGLTPRTLRKITFKTYMKNSESNLLVDFLKVMRRCVRVEKADEEELYQCYKDTQRQRKGSSINETVDNVKLKLLQCAGTQTDQENWKTIMVTVGTSTEESELSASKALVVAPQPEEIVTPPIDGPFEIPGPSDTVKDGIRSEPRSQSVVKNTGNSSDEPKTVSPCVDQSEPYSESVVKGVSDSDTDFNGEDIHNSPTSSIVKKRNVALKSEFASSKVPNCFVDLTRSYVPDKLLKRVYGDTDPTKYFPVPVNDTLFEIISNAKNPKKPEISIKDNRMATKALSGGGTNILPARVVKENVATPTAARSQCTVKTAAVSTNLIVHNHGKVESFVSSSDLKPALNDRFAGVQVRCQVAKSPLQLNSVKTNSGFSTSATPVKMQVTPANRIVGPKSFKEKVGYAKSRNTVGMVKNNKMSPMTSVHQSPEVITVPDDDDETFSAKDANTFSISKPVATKKSSSGIPDVKPAAIGTLVPPVERQVYITDSSGNTTTSLQPMKKRMYDCSKCEFSFLFKRDLTRHLSTAHGETCMLCKKTFRGIEGLRRHFKSCPARKEVVAEKLPALKIGVESKTATSGCTKNLQAFKSVAVSEAVNIQRDVSVEPGAKRMKFGCDQCDRVFESNKEFERHQIFHQDDRPYKCTKCPKTFKSESSLQFHIKLDHSVRPTYACSVCGILCASEVEVEEHERAVHDGNSSSSENLSSESAHTPDTPYSQLTSDPVSSVSSTANASDTEQAHSDVSFKLRAPKIEGESILSSTTEPMSIDFPLDSNYQSCAICGECVLGKQELLQHNQLFHNTGESGELGSSESSELFQYSVDVPVPEADTVIEVETTDEFLQFLSAF